VTGIDMAEAGLEVAKLHLLESGLDVDYQKIPVEEFAEKHAGKFDVVT
ncbi:MAG TPA: bifunctional 3-demethylubiquinol 3-O-methyltransferase/2-polyprenyl-6-hydroxyphenol methylase, partial [Gammaproteobacteria bacterium]|nr:bifunctional 3-demethylubiquinol 3-O-methyltransferase/2-polyprenyl-6-hydroxyphenol methylase [Gammaproteobacteria bacterium]